MSDDEWIPIWKCEKMAVFRASPALPLRNAAPDLRLLQPGDWVQQDKGAPTRHHPAPTSTLHHTILYNVLCLWVYFLCVEQPP